MSYLVRPVGFSFLTSANVVPPPSICAFAECRAGLDGLSETDRGLLLSRLRFSPDPLQGIRRFQNSGQQVFTITRNETWMRLGGTSSHQNVTWQLGGSDEEDSSDSLPQALRGGGWKALIAPPPAVVPASKKDTLAQLQNLPEGLDQARKYAARILQSFDEGDEVSESLRLRAVHFLAATDSTEMAIPDCESPPGDTVPLPKAVDLFSVDGLFSPFDNEDSPEGKRVISLSNLVFKMLQDATERNFAEKVLALARQDALSGEKEKIFREYLLKVAAVHLVRFPFEDRDVIKPLLQEIYDALKIPSSGSPISIDSIPDEAQSVLQWVRVFDSENRVLGFFHRVGFGGGEELIGKAQYNLWSAVKSK